MNDINIHVNGEVYLMPTAKDCDARAAEQDASEASKIGDENTHDISKFLKMGDNLQLVRFRGDNFVKLVGRTPAHDGVLPVCYEIEVDKGEGHVATCYRNGKVLFELRFPFSSCRLEAMAVSALHRWFEDTRDTNRRRHASRKRRREAARVAAAEKAKED